MANVFTRTVSQSGIGVSPSIDAVRAFSGMAVLGTGSATLEVTLDPKSTVPTWFTVGAAKVANTNIGPLGYSAGAVRLNVVSGSWTLLVSEDLV